MSDTSPPPLAPGEFFDSSAGHDGEQFEGREFVFADVNETTGAKRSYKDVVRRIVKNSSGSALRGKRCVVLNGAGTEITGYSRIGSAAAGAQICFPLDEYLPSAGLGNGDWGYVVVQGNAICLTGATGSEATSIPAGTPLIAITATTAEETSTAAANAGRLVKKISTGDAGATRALNLLAQVGAALSESTTDETDQDVLVNVVRKSGFYTDY